jgi:tRNA threonylcarbamoyl adenosine modification protein YeaZ
MRLLAIDTALPSVSACVLDSDSAEPLSIESRPMERGHAEALLPLIERVVAATEGGFASLQRVAVTVGPGSFTGIRIGLAAGNSIALVRQIEIVGVSTLAALAAPRVLECVEGAVVAAIDARHGQIFVAAYGADGRALLSPRRASPQEAIEELGEGPLEIVGSGAALLAKAARAAGVRARIANEAVAPDIVFVARLGLVAIAEEAPPRPLYLKAADAKPLAGATVDAGDAS